ncbi:hypothetical protein OSSY52_01820 [Tepiditoga spiralis]|uniref:DUF3352 domain-containing protein n=1 Tax=Tepiditoga spiralis TaxID=2108365 RepID=A0A7G1G1A8_9BACT|nr:hypothetical protein [Tepiditoga spiralis]BBE30041.1 hypothetical protein OSSY52_01820 [Tepiditoga spiralis]
MKKITIVLLVALFSIVSFSNVLQYVPSNSKAFFYVKNLTKSYESLKTIPSLKSIFLDPINLEIMLSSYAEMYMTSSEVESSAFYDLLQNVDLAGFIVEPSNETYHFGVVMGPFKDSKKFIDYINKILISSLKESGVSIDIVEKENYVVFVMDKDLYKEAKKGVSINQQNIENGFYYVLNSSKMKGNGYAYVKDGYLIGKSNGAVSSGITNTNFIKPLDNYKFPGTYMIVSGYIPTDLSSLKSIIKNFGDFDLVQKLLSSSNGIELGGNVELNSDSMEFNGKEYIKINTKNTIKDIIPLLEDNSIKYKKVNDNEITMSIETMIDDPENIGEKKKVTTDLNLWKDNEELYIYQGTPKEYKDLIKGYKKLSENTLFNMLSEKIGSANLAFAFFDLSKLFSGYGIEGNFGGLININYKENDKLEISFIIK